MNKAIDAWLYSRKPASNEYYIQIFFRVVHFLQGACGLLIGICTEADNSLTAS